MPSEVSITVSQVEFEAASRLAKDTLARFAGQSGFYNNTYNSHLRGKLGEIACARWLESSGVAIERVFEQLNRVGECDIITSGKQVVRLDVKTWDMRYWDEMGRCVAVGQIASLQQKADGIVWCISPATLEAETKIQIVGWNSMDDVAKASQRMTGPMNRRQVHNYQVDPDHLRSGNDLIDVLTR